jgi:DNA-directed RNA polymerase subunit RPC12/RpoP
MDDYICKRCDAILLNLNKSHLQRKIFALFIEHDLDRDILIDELYQKTSNNKTYDCEYCNMKFNRLTLINLDIKICKVNLLINFQY